jgi:hypothetical protein
LANSDTIDVALSTVNVSHPSCDAIVEAAQDRVKAVPSECDIPGLPLMTGIARSPPAADAEGVSPTQVPLSDTEAILIGLPVAVVVLLSLTWELVQHFTVMAHEGIHGVVGSLSGRTVQWIVLESNAEGGTRVVPTTGPGYLVGAFVGYLGPSAFGLGAARLIQYGHIVVVLWLVMGFLAVLLISLKRRSFALVTIPLAGFLIFLILKHTSLSAQVVAAYAITWFLLFSGVRMVVADGVGNGDADILNGRTHFPQLLWYGLWLAGTVAAVLIGAKWMLHPAVHPPAAPPSG